MEQSASVLSAQIQFIEERLSLIHVPIEFYSYYVQALIQLLDAEDESGYSEDDDGTYQGSTGQSLSWTKAHPFLNISITSLECSIVCSRTLAERLILPAIERLSGVSRGTISSEEYVAVSVVGEGLDSGQRVLDLSTPLAMAGISIFFITTYFSDYILVPFKAKTQVVKALETRGFAFSESSHSFVNVAASQHRPTSSSADQRVIPTTPPPATESELQQRTMNLLKRKNIFPVVDHSLRLLQLAGRSDGESRSGLEIGVIKCLASPPKFFSITLTRLESPSILICKTGLKNFGPDSDSLLLGSKENYLLPFLFDLRELSTEATGIVCGVSSRLVGGAFSGQIGDLVDMRYLSTYKGAAVIVEQEDLSKAIALLKEGETGLDVKQI